jgi:hypothetical protein
MQSAPILPQHLPPQARRQRLRLPLARLQQHLLLLRRQLQRPQLQQVRLQPLANST